MAFNPHRKGNLDLIRATAISLVLIHHSVQMSSIAEQWIRQTAIYGQYGVDLFFVLSGWLVGGLYWRERHEFGNVLISRFWIRRWMRTIPPYLAALLASWLAVYIARREPFDFGYLAFVQNYYLKIPFFLVSWSLCVEEHFYLLVPLVFFIFGRFAYRRRNVLIFAVALFAAPLLRLLTYSHISDEFGYSLTATHLHMGGLILGMFLSYVATEAPQDFNLLVRASPYVIAASGTGLAFLALDSGAWKYVWWETVVSIFFSAVLLVAISKPDIRGRFAAIVFPIALVSYSIYLTHPLALHVAVEITHRVPGGAASLLYFPVSIFLIAASSALFYFIFEKASIGIRDRYWPRRVHNLS